MAKRKDSNTSDRAAKSATSRLEEHEPRKKRTRKSTRGGTGHNKPENTLERRQEHRLNTPEARHARK